MASSSHSSTLLDIELNQRAITPACVAISVAADLLLAITMCILLHFKRAGTEGSVGGSLDVYHLAHAVLVWKCSQTPTTL
jgi:hypothetical protein